MFNQPAIKQMYALCLLAAVSLRHHICENGSRQLLAKNLMLQMPTTLTTTLTQPGEAALNNVVKPKKEKQAAFLYKCDNCSDEHIEPKAQNSLPWYPKNLTYYAHQFITMMNPQFSVPPDVASYFYKSMSRVVPNVGSVWLT